MGIKKGTLPLPSHQSKQTDLNNYYKKNKILKEKRYQQKLGKFVSFIFHDTCSTITEANQSFSTLIVVKLVTL